MIIAVACPDWRGLKGLDDLSRLIVIGNIAVACPDWRGLKVAGHAGTILVGKIAEAYPAWRGLKDTHPCLNAHLTEFIAEAYPAWRGLKVEGMGRFGLGVDIAEAYPAWRGLKVRVGKLCSAGPVIAEAYPAWRGLKENGILVYAANRRFIAEAYPAWRGLKARAARAFYRWYSYCRGLPRMEGTERLLQRDGL